NHRSELLFAIELHSLANRKDDDRIEERFAARGTAIVDDRRPPGQSIGHALAKVGSLSGLGQRGDTPVLLPGHSNLQFPKFFGEAFKETLDDRSVDDQHLERRATLTIEREGPRE